jgi:transcriptional regulator with XRE-family HTH domain
MRFGDRLKELREAKDLSQKALAEAAGFTAAAVSRWESGLQVPAFDAVMALCEVLGVRCTAFDGCEFAPAKGKRGRGRPIKK